MLAPIAASQTLFVSRGPRSTNRWRSSADAAWKRRGYSTMQSRNSSFRLQFSSTASAIADKLIIVPLALVVSVLFLSRSPTTRSVPSFAT